MGYRYIYIYIYPSKHLKRRLSFQGSFEVLNAISQPNGHIFVDSPSIQCRNSTWKLEYRFDEENVRWIRLSKSTKYR